MNNQGGYGSYYSQPATAAGGASGAANYGAYGGYGGATASTATAANPTAASSYYGAAAATGYGAAPATATPATSAYYSGAPAATSSASYYAPATETAQAPAATTTNMDYSSNNSNAYYNPSAQTSPTGGMAVGGGSGGGAPYGATPAQSYQAQPTYAAQAPPATAAPAATNATDENGLRWTWSCYPNTVKSKAKENPGAASIPLPEMVVPMSCMYAPLHPLDPSHMVLDSPAALRCGNCGAYCSRHSSRDQSSYWVCLACLRRNAFMPNPAAGGVGGGPAISDQHPAFHHDTVEYILPDHSGGATATVPAFIFIVDTCIPAEELQALQSNLLASLAHLPRQSLVGLVTFGTSVQVWELGRPEGCPISKCFVLYGNDPYTAEQMQRMLQVSESAPVRGRLLAPLANVEESLTSIFAELQVDGAATAASKRPLRPTGTAVDAATYLLEALAPPPLPQQQQQPLRPAAAVGFEKMGKILLFTGGPCTRGPGAVTSTDKADMMRFHRDIIEGETPYYDAAFNFYNGIAKRLTAIHACLDIFVESLDQVGVMEMRHCVDHTGGTLVSGDVFTHELFSETLKRYWERCDLRGDSKGESSAAAEDFSAHSGFAVKIHIFTSVDTKVSAVHGPGDAEGWLASRAAKAPAAKPGAGAMELSVSSLDQGMNLAVLFDTATLDGAANMAGSGGGRTSNRFIQFVVQFVTPQGQRRIRITSICQPVAPTEAPPNYYVASQAFDQTCAATIVARMAVSILERHPSKWDDAKRWLDTMLVRFVRRYGNFTPGQADSLSLQPCLALFPSFMYNLRRSEYFMVLNISPDETTFKRHWLMREGVDSCMMMIQPTLDAYDIEEPYAKAVPLDSSSLRADNIVLMDAYFNVHIMWGTTIYEWIKAKYHENPDYAYFAALLEHAEADAQAILATRYPYPRFSRTDADGSEARHVKTRVNPATNYNSSPSGAGYGMAGGPQGAVEQGEVIYTDDASIKTFMSSLKKAVVVIEEKQKAAPLGSF